MPQSLPTSRSSSPASTLEDDPMPSGAAMAAFADQLRDARRVQSVLLQPGPPPSLIADAVHRQDTTTALATSQFGSTGDGLILVEEFDLTPHTGPALRSQARTSTAAVAETPERTAIAQEAERLIASLPARLLGSDKDLRLALLDIGIVSSKVDPQPIAWLVRNNLVNLQLVKFRQMALCELGGRALRQYWQSNPGADAIAIYREAIKAVDHGKAIDFALALNSNSTVSDCNWVLPRLLQLGIIGIYDEVSSNDIGAGVESMLTTIGHVLAARDTRADLSQRQTNPTLAVATVANAAESSRQAVATGKAENHRCRQALTALKNTLTKAAPALRGGLRDCIHVVTLLDTQMQSLRGDAVLAGAVPPDLQQQTTRATSALLRELGRDALETLAGLPAPLDYLSDDFEAQIASIAKRFAVMAWNGSGMTLPQADALVRDCATLTAQAGRFHCPPLDEPSSLTMAEPTLSNDVMASEAIVLLGRAVKMRYDIQVMLAAEALLAPPTAQTKAKSKRKPRPVAAVPDPTEPRSTRRFRDVPQPWGVSHRVDDPDLPASMQEVFHAIRQSNSEVANYYGSEELLQVRRSHETQPPRPPLNRWNTN